MWAFLLFLCSLVSSKAWLEVTPFFPQPEDIAYVNRLVTGYSILAKRDSFTLHSDYCEVLDAASSILQEQAFLDYGEGNRFVLRIKYFLCSVYMARDIKRPTLDFFSLMTQVCDFAPSLVAELPPLALCRAVLASAAKRQPLDII